jgi:hypothetical protein
MSLHADPFSRSRPNVLIKIHPCIIVLGDFNNMRTLLFVATIIVLSFLDKQTVAGGIGHNRLSHNSVHPGRLFYVSEWVSDCCLTQDKQLSAITWRDQLHSEKWWWYPLCTRPNSFNCIFIVHAYCIADCSNTRPNFPTASIVCFFIHFFQSKCHFHMHIKVTPIYMHDLLLLLNSRSRPNVLIKKVC